MKRLYFTIVAALAVVGAMAQSRKVCIDQNWQYAYGSHQEATATDFDDSQWRTLNLPHDWSVESEAAELAGGTHIGPFSKEHGGGYQNANTIGGEAWYRKTLVQSAAERNGRTILYLEGAYNHTELWVNGTRVFFNPYGYQSFRVDITPYLYNAGAKNRLALRVTNEGANTRWYAGSGIFRHVWLLHTPHTHLDDWGTIIKATPEQVSVTTTVVNETRRSAEGKVIVRLSDSSGSVVAEQEAAVSVLDGTEKQLTLSIPVSNMQLWSPDSPTLYTASITYRPDAAGTTGSNTSGNTSATTGEDHLDIPFGVKTVSIDAQRGMLLNGQPILLKGGCVHHDHGLLGAASWDAAEARKVRLLKEYGYNAVRCSHNMPSEAFLNECDRQGLLVMDECFDQWYAAKNSDDYHNFFPEYFDRDMQMMLRRDVNHPSIFMWSIGNEIPDRGNDRGVETSAELVRLAHCYDDRPTTNASNSWEMGTSGVGRWDDWAVRAWSNVEVCGYNYQYENYRHDHANHPDRVIIGTESYPKLSSQNWDLVESEPYVIGDFIWTAMDYIGEAGIGSASYTENVPMFRAWPWMNGWCGDIDLIGQKKPQSYYRDVVWRRSPITMAVMYERWESISAWGWQEELPKWTWPDVAEGTKMRINVYSRAQKVRLYLNSKLIGEATPGSTYWAGFTVGYQPGTLRAVNVENGVETDEFVLQTAGTAAAIRLTADRESYNATGTDLVYVTAELIDSEGRLVPDTGRKINFATTGSGTLLACGNASPTDMESFRNNTPALYEGRAMAIIATAEEAGSIDVVVSAEGLPSATLSIPVESVTTGISQPGNDATLGYSPIGGDTSYYDLSGRLVPQPAKGLNIVRQADGSVRKIMVK